MTDSVVDQSGEAAPRLFPGVFAPLGKWLRPKRAKFRWNASIERVMGLRCEANHSEYVSRTDLTSLILQMQSAPEGAAKKSEGEGGRRSVRPRPSQSFQ